MVVEKEKMDSLKKKANEYLYMNWLRPEGVVWDTVAYNLISKEILKGKRILEIGIGNGYNSFMLLNGKFTNDFDWYYNVDTKGFWNNKDIYDSFNLQLNIKKFIRQRPEKKIQIAIDHKNNLLKQAEQLNFVDELICADANKEITFHNIDTIFSNILYWLNDPFTIIKNAIACLNMGGKMIIVFPNSNFYQYCISYTNTSPLWKRINRGRADCMIWRMDIDEFKKKLKGVDSRVKIVYFSRYLSEETLRVWDIGLRPLSPHLIDMANSLSPQKRLEIKEEWCETCKPFIYDLLNYEIEKGAEKGAFNFLVLKKTEA